jgi:glycosyltransferase involved in cell wall biosynthesis
MKRVLLIAYHFPPQAGSSGAQRTLRFAQHLPRLGWQPIVLTATEGAYERTAEDLAEQIPDDVIVRRALAFDTARLFSIKGRYLAVLARPDRWMSWQFDGVRLGSRLVREFRPQVIWSTFPIATAHVIAHKLHARSGLPWIADFRDPMAQNGYPADPQTWAMFKRIEEGALREARFSVFTTPGAAREYRRRYGDAASHIRVIENGYDEENFAAAEVEAAALGALNLDAVTIVHSGIVYPRERDPRHLMKALSMLVNDGTLRSTRLRVRFRASVNEKLLLQLARQYGVEDLIEVRPPVGYRDALVEMLRADGLLLLQASNCNDQIPAKLYEYLRARRPLLALTDPAGDTGRALADAEIPRVARLDSVAEIEALLRQFLRVPQARKALLPSEAAVRAASRQERTQALASLLDEALQSA